jgi:CheY-like chemotaxis protein
MAAEDMDFPVTTHAPTDPRCWYQQSWFGGDTIEASTRGSPFALPGAISSTELATVLLVDDDVIDVTAVRRAFHELKIANPLVVARNGIEAFEMLRGENGYAKLRAPFLILLDLNMPRMGGMEFLEEPRVDPELHRSLVIVMTTSAAEEDRDRAYGQNVAGFVLKSRPGQTFGQTIAALENYWRAIELPD